MSATGMAWEPKRPAQRARQALSGQGWYERTPVRQIGLEGYTISARKEF